MLTQWVLDKIADLKDEPRLLIRDSLRLLPEANDGAIHRFANEHNFTVIIAATNLAFREIYEKSIVTDHARKLLVIDRAPARRKTSTLAITAPPPFYPDLLANMPATARLEISLRQFLIEKTGDPNWPKESNDPQFVRLINRYLKGVLVAHTNLRAADPTRFTDHDFKTIVAFAALGVPEAAFRRPEARIYWHIGLFGSTILAELDGLVPEVAQQIRRDLRKAPAPFCWFADHSPELILRAFYLAAILAPHLTHWKLLLASIDPELKPFSEMDAGLLHNAAAELIALDPQRVHRDLLDVENTLSGEALQLILLEQMQLVTHRRFTEIIEKEQYSILFRSLALLTALDDRLANAPLQEAHQRLIQFLTIESSQPNRRFIEQRHSESWENLKAAYQRLATIQEIYAVLANGVKALKVKATAELSFDWFRTLWNDQRVNRLEYYVSALERQVTHADFLPRPANDLPSVFVNTAQRIQERLRKLHQDIGSLLNELNRGFQECVALNYQTWIAGKSEIRLTARFLERVIKPHWDPEQEPAVVFVFDGMRYDIWDELVRPLFEERMAIIAEFPGLALLPSETHISRKAIFAGAFPDAFDHRKGEDVLLQNALQQTFGWQGEIQVVAPAGMGTGETVRYRAGQIDFYIFELCDKELHNIPVKTLPDGRTVPGRPLAFVYQQHIKNIIETEVQSIIRNLKPDTKVFVVADHGFGAVGRQPLRLDLAWLNEPNDCNYQNAWLRQPLAQVAAPYKIQQNTLEFSTADLHLPQTAEGTDRLTKRTWQKSFTTILFPKTGYAFARPNAQFNPDAYSHGGISLPELIVPMIVLQVKPTDAGWLILDAITGPVDLIEGEAAEFRLPIRFTRSGLVAEVRVEARAVYQQQPTTPQLPQQVQYLTPPGGEMIFRFTPDPADATEAEHKTGRMARTLNITIHYQVGQRLVRQTRSFDFRLQLDPAKIVRRVPTHLGKILGLTPKNLR